jgi:nucleoside-specific outer membrane channel protein Tsx
MPTIASESHLQFADTSLSSLHGGGFEVDPSPQSTLTLEQASGWSVGDLYWFVDSLHYTHDDTGGQRSSWYGEFSPRLSLGKLSDGELRAGPIKDVLIAATYELGRDAQVTESGLLGLGVDLDLPGFRYFQANIYARKDLHQGGWDTWQMTLSGAYPYTFGNQRFLVDGFLDYVAPGGPHGWNLHLVPQLKWDLGHALGHTDDKLWLGAEIDLWRNKFGIADSTGFDANQGAASLLLRWHF